jgi:O-antigen ligase
MGNFNLVSAHSQVTHNAYTQVSSEMGIAALLLYLAFMLVPLRRLGQVERETFAQPHLRQVYYLSVGLQVSLLAYMVSSFFASVAYQWYIYYLVGYAICLRRIHSAALVDAKPAAVVVGVKQSVSQDKRITV